MVRLTYWTKDGRQGEVHASVYSLAWDILSAQAPTAVRVKDGLGGVYRRIEGEWVQLPTAASRTTDLGVAFVLADGGRLPERFRR